MWLADDNALHVQRALKVVREDAITDAEKFFEEGQKLDRLEHRNIVRIYGAGRLDAERLYLAMEYLKNGSAEPRPKGSFLPARRAKSLLVDASHGLAYIHQQEFLHRDIKPANILVADDGSGKVSDFGLVEQMNAAGEADPFGYTMHLAPEEVVGGPATVLTDIYALGLTAYRLFNGDDLLPVIPDDDLEDAIAAGQFPARDQYQPFIPARLRRVLNKAMEVNPADRYQTVDAFRLQLEQCPIRYDWSFAPAGASGVWIGTDGARTWKVSFTNAPDNRWAVETRTGMGALRRRSSDCIAGRSAAVRRATLHRIMARITGTGR